jgi:hypothetical protein
MSAGLADYVYGYLAKYRAAGGVGLPPQADQSNTALSNEELALMSSNPRVDALHALFVKIANNPNRGDVCRVLEGTCNDSEDLVAAYTPEVHEQLCALVAPLKELINDVDNANRSNLRPPVRAIGMELDKLGGKKAQLAVYYAMNALLVDQTPRCEDGAQWSNSGSTLQFAWDGCGKWMA